MVRIKGESEPVPLKSLGDGVVRMFQIALALERAEKNRPAARPAAGAATQGSERLAGGLLLIDEVENGIHYTVLPRLWRFLFQAAKIRNVQVFATTHSWDCIKGFQIAAAQEPEVSCMLVRLGRRDQANKAVLFDRDELPHVTEDPMIEVR
jgi:hypothetical protein